VSHNSLVASHNNKGSLADSSNSGLLGEQSSQKWEIPCLGRLLICPEKFAAANFILGGEIGNRTNRRTNKQANNKRYIHTLPIGMCG